MVKRLNEAKLDKEYENFHYLIDGEDIDSWDQDDYYAVMRACEEFKYQEKIERYYHPGITDDKLLQNRKLQDCRKKIQMLVDIANMNAEVTESLNKTIRESAKGLSSLDELMDYYYNEVFRFEDWGKSKEELFDIFSYVILKNFRGIQDDIEEAMWNKMMNKW